MRSHSHDARPHPDLRGRVLATALLLTALAGGCGGSEPHEPVRSWAEVRGQRIVLEIARTPAQQQRGLGYRDSLPWGHGMLFVYDKPSFHGFWMKGMRFDIDIVWIRDNRIVDISYRVPHVPEGDPLPTVRPRELSDTVLEVPAGYAEANGWRHGDRVAIHPGDG